MVDNIVYVSLGNDCSVAYQLQKYGLRTLAYPFDWIRTNNLKDIVNIIDSMFQYFVDPAYLEVKEESSKFPLIGDDWNDDMSENIVLKHKMYNVVFPHDLKKDGDMTLIKNKYNRRIERFYDVIKNENVKKIFIRVSNKCESSEEIKNTLERYATNFEIKIITLDKKTKFSSWKKNELDWPKIFNC